MICTAIGAYLAYNIRQQAASLTAFFLFFRPSIPKAGEARTYGNVGIFGAYLSFPSSNRSARQYSEVPSTVRGRTQPIRIEDSILTFSVQNGSDPLFLSFLGEGRTAIGQPFRRRSL
jgi:hypothetical protein